MAIAANALITLAQAKSYIGLTDTTHDIDIQDMINSASQTIEQYINKSLLTATYTEKFQGNNRQILNLNNYPITSIVYVHFFGFTLDPTNDDYECDDRLMLRGQLYKETGWTSQDYLGGIGNDPMSGQKIIEVQYVAGYTLDTLPGDIIMAAKKLVALEYKESPFGENRLGLEAAAEGGVKETYFKKETEMPLNISAVLDRYSRKRV